MHSSTKIGWLSCILVCTNKVLATLISDAKSIGDIKPGYRKVGCQKLSPF